MGNRVVRESELGGLWRPSGIILLGQVFIHGCDLIMASWDTLNLKQHEIRKPISLRAFPFIAIAGYIFLQILSMKSNVVQELNKNGTSFSFAVVRDKCSELAADASRLQSTHRRFPCDMEHTWLQSH